MKLGSLSRRDRGSALALAILVTLILLVVGVTVAYLTQTEDRVSGNTRLAKVAFYAAEYGLREGETIVQNTLRSSPTATPLLNPTGTPPANLTLPGGGVAIPLVSGATFFYQKVLAGAGLDDSGYSIYVRNNVEDPGGTTTDTDNTVNIVVVGYALLGGGNTDPFAQRVLATKIVEEQVSLGAFGTESGAQKAGNQGGTGAGTKG